MQTEFNIQELLAKIELPLNALDKLQKARCVSVAQQGLNDFKQIVKEQRRVLAKRHHPDKGGDEKRMQEINNICDWILGSEIIMPVQQPIVTYYSYFSTSSATTASDTATTFNY